MNEQDQTPMHSLDTGAHKGSGPPRRLWPHDDADISDGPTDSATVLTNLTFVRSALRRRARLVFAVALAGLIASLGVYVARPAPYQASTTVLVPAGAYPNAIADTQAIAQSRAVAALAVSKLRLSQSAGSFAGDYTVTALTDRVLLITVKAASSDAAVREANAVATAFLTFQARMLKTQERLVSASLRQQVIAAKAHLSSISAQISTLSAASSSAKQRAKLSNLRTERRQANLTLAALKQAAANAEANTQVTATQTLRGSRVLDAAAALPEHRKKRLLLYAGGGLLGGLVLGLGIVVVGGLISERLRRRDDVAHALGAPVELSVGTVRLSPRWWRSSGRAAAQDAEIQRIVSHLGSKVSRGSTGPASLAVVPVDDQQLPAACLGYLALACARQGMRVVVADLCRGAPVGLLLGATAPGVWPVRVQGVELTVTVPEPNEVQPLGPLRHTSHKADATAPLDDACASADLLLTLAAVDPSLGGDHLAGWAHEVIAFVTAGEATAERIHNVGEMVRFAGVTRFSGVLVGADKTDESLGLVRASGDATVGYVTLNGQHSDVGAGSHSASDVDANPAKSTSGATSRHEV